MGGRERAPETRGQGTSGRESVWITLLIWFMVAQALFWLTWWAGYNWLPAQALQGRSAAAALPLEHLAVWPRALGILGWNLLWAGLFAVGGNLVRVGRVPVGLVAVALLWGLYGLVLGTNSFATPLPVRPAPSLLLALGRTGCYELTGYLCLAVATARRTRWQQDHWLGGATRQVKPEPLTMVERGLAGLGLILIAVSAVREAAAWIVATGGS